MYGKFETPNHEKGHMLECAIAAIALPVNAANSLEWSRFQTFKMFFSIPLALSDLNRYYKGKKMSVGIGLFLLDHTIHGGKNHHRNNSTYGTKSN